MELAAGGLVCGVDEAGRGPLAGPVVAAAVVIPPGALTGGPAARIDDSKKLDRPLRESLFEVIRREARTGVGLATVEEIDLHNILQATFLAMRRALDDLRLAPDLVLIDGNRLPPLPWPAQAVVGGDGRCLSIAAASIIAKVTRDRIMTALARDHAGFGWETNFGYGTPQHRAAVRRLGLTRHHRRSFCSRLLSGGAAGDSLTPEV